MVDKGKLIGVGTGPGDPELLTLRAVRAIAEADVVAFFAKNGNASNARRIVADHMRAEAVELPLLYPVTTEIDRHHEAYSSAIAGFFDEAADAVAGHLCEGRTVAVLSEGDPLFYGSYMHLHVRLAERFDTEVVPGITAMSGAWSSAGVPITQGDDVLSVLPGTMREEDLAARLAAADAAVIMKVGRNLEKIRRALATSGRLSRAIYVERATMDNARMMPLADKPDCEAPYFAIVLVPGVERQAMSGRLSVIGLGPGNPEQTTPEVLRAVAEADEFFGYGPYLDRLELAETKTRHAFDNRQELDRAKAALTRAAEGASVCIVSGGDPGVFAMAAAVCEAVEAGPAEWRGITLTIHPGVTAMLAVAARAGAPLGHDFCAMSLSDNLKPWELIESRLDAAASAGFVIALYNPVSRARPWQLGKAMELLARKLPASTPVIFGHAVGRPDERMEIVPLERAASAQADMATCIIVGSPETRIVERPGQPPLVYTPRSSARASA